MFNKKNILEHTALEDEFPQIAPSKNFIPSWYKDEKKFSNGMNPPKRFPYDPTFKLCSAFGDTFTSGYMIPLPVDISVEQTEGGPVISWRDTSQSFLEIRQNETNKNLPDPVGYSANHYVWQTKHLFKIPKGYSVLFTHPLNRFDLPFLTLSGIIDGEMAVYQGNVPVYFNSTFEGIIEAGTPIAQLLFFKTENWKSEINKDIVAEAHSNDRKSLHAAYGWYKKNIWKKKMYE